MLKTIAITLVALSVCSFDLVGQDKGSLVKSSQIVGTQIKDSSGQAVGEIKDFIVDRDKGNIAFAIVSFSDVNNANDKLFAVPWDSMKPAADHSALALTIAKDRLDKAPAYDESRFADLADARTSAELRTFYGASASPAPVAPSQTDREKVAGETNRDRDMNRDRDVNRDRDLDANRDINRDRDMNRDRDLDANRGDMNANRDRVDSNRRIVSYSGTVKSLNRGNPSQLVVTTDRGELGAELAPSTYLDQQQIVLDPNSNVTVRGFETNRSGRRTFIATEVLTNGRTFRLRGGNDYAPLWTETTTAAPVTADATLPNGSAYNNAPMNSTTSSAVYDVTGTVSYVDSGACESAQGRQVTIRTDTGDRTIALGPGTYFDNKRWVLRPNESVTIRGYDADYRGNRVFIATEVHKGNDVWRIRNDDGTPLWR